LNWTTCLSIRETRRSARRIFRCRIRYFIGGSGGKLGEIMKNIAAFDREIRVTVSAVTLETIAEAGEILGNYDADYDVIQATVGRGRKIGSYHIMDTNNPVMIFTATIHGPGGQKIHE